MSTVEIRPSKFSDVKALCQIIREKDKQECLKLGYEPRTALLYSYKHALIRKTALVNGSVAAMWGVVGQTTSEIGFPYLVTGMAVLEVSPIRFVRIYKQSVEEMKQLFPTLENYVDHEYTESVRLLRLSGFYVDEPNASGFARFHLTTRTFE